MTKKFMEQQHTTKQREMKKTSGNNFFFCVACVPLVLALGLIFFYFYYFSMILLSFQLMLLHLTSQLNHSGPYYFEKIILRFWPQHPHMLAPLHFVLFCKYYYMYRQVLTKPQGDLIKRTTGNRAHQVASLRESQIDGEKPFYPDRGLFLLRILALLLCSIDPLI